VFWYVKAGGTYTNDYALKGCIRAAPINMALL
jgi:hypothetical protein